MQLNDPFPVECLPKRVQETFLSEFQGAHPTVLDVTRVSDDHWLKLPGFGPMMLARLRSVVAESCEQVQPPALTRMTLDELLARHRHLLVRQDLLRAMQRKVRDQIRATKAELWIRGIATRAE